MTICNILSSPAFTHAYAMAGGFALSWIISFIKHAPPPFRNQVWRGAAFDATQDTAKNNERIGERRESAAPPPDNQNPLH